MRPRQVAGLVAFAAAALASGCGGGASSGPPPPPPPPPEVITITTATTLQSVQSVPFSVTLQETGAKTAVTWSITAGQLPAGLTLDATTGIISGTPTSQDFEQVIIQARDTGASTTKTFQVNVWAKFTLQPITAAAAHTNVPYNLMLTANSGISAWSLVGGNFPPGLTFPQGLAGAPSITGTPTTVGSYTFTVQATDNTVPQTATVDITIVVDSRVTITKSSLAVGGETHAFSDSFTAVNGAQPLHWSVSGNFPPGLSVNATTGAVAGTPTAGGFYSYTVQVTDSSVPAQLDSAQNSMSIESVPKISFNTSPAYLGTFYVASIYISGGSGQFSVSVTSGSLPAGLGLSWPLIIGTPTQLGTFTANIQATDTSSPPYTVSGPITIVVVPTPLVLSNLVASPTPVNALYHSQVGVTGGTPPYSWALNSGQLPLGVALGGTTGFLDGTPSKTGLYSFQVRTTDSSSPPQNNFANYFIEVRPGRVRNDSIATATPLLLITSSNSTSISPYVDPIDAVIANPDTDYFKLAAVGGSSVHVETLAARFINNDMLDTVIELVDQNGQKLASCGSPAFTSTCMNDDLDSRTTDSALDFKVPGAPTTTTIFYLHVLDWRGDARPDMPYGLQVTGTVTPLGITSSNGFRGTTRGTNFQQGLSTIGQTGNVTWTVASGTLPPGWSLSSTGTLGGVATTDGYYNFVVRAADSSTPPQIATAQYSITVVEPIAITSSPNLPNACTFKPFSFAIQTSGGVAPLQFDYFGSVPAGMNFNSSNGVFSGTPTAVGSVTGALNVYGGGSVASQQLTLNVVDCP